MKQYTYRDNQKGREVTFSCAAEDIIEADQKYEEATGKSPAKQGHIGCSFENVQVIAEKVAAEEGVEEYEIRNGYIVTRKGEATTFTNIGRYAEEM